MKKFMLVGAVSAGKTSLMQAIYGQDLSYQKTQAIDFKDNIIDTPGEYLEQRFRYRSLGITAADTDLIVLVQSCTDLRCVFAPGLSSMFAKPMVGVVTKIDLAKSPTDIARAKKNLQLNDKITHMSKRRTREKLLSYLSSESLRQGSLEFDIPFDRQQLADYLCIERSAMSAELSRLQKDGLLATERSHFRLIAPFSPDVSGS